MNTLKSLVKYTFAHNGCVVFAVDAITPTLKDLLKDLYITIRETTNVGPVMFLYTDLCWVHYKNKLNQ
jgi:hypothetical protein